jgi:hypothetical protein
MCTLHLFSRYVQEANFGQGELAHRALKAFYLLTSKLDTPAQLAKHEHRHCVLRRIAEGGISSPSSQPHANVLPSTLSEKHHYIAPTWNNPVDIFTFLREHDSDPAIKVEVALHF